LVRSTGAFEDFIRLVVGARVGGEAEASPGVRSVAKMHVRQDQRIGVLIARANTEFILAGVMNSSNDINPVAEREAQLQRTTAAASSNTGRRFAFFQSHSFTQQYLSSPAVGSGDGRPLLKGPAPADPWAPKEVPREAVQEAGSNRARG